MTREEEIKKLKEELTEALAGGLMESFVGMPATESTAYQIKSALTSQIQELINNNRFNSPMPRIEVNVDGPMCTVNFFDPKTGEEVGLQDYFEKYVVGFYE